MKGKKAKAIIEGRYIHFSKGTMKKLARSAVKDGMTFNQFCEFMSHCLVGKPSVETVSAALQKDGIVDIFLEAKPE